jgi:hypothetical protein
LVAHGKLSTNLKSNQINKPKFEKNKAKQKLQMHVIGVVDALDDFFGFFLV